MSAPTSSQPPAKRSRLDFDSNITVLVGKEEKSFLVHEGIIIRHSKFFYAACKGEFKEAKDRTVRLPEVEEADFKSYLHWIYSRTVVVAAQEQLDVQPDVTGRERFLDLARLYVVADQLDDRALRNAIIDAILELVRDAKYHPGVLAINIAYDQATESSTIRKLMRDFHLYSPLCPEFLEQKRQVLHSNFIFDLAYSNTRGFVRPSQPSLQNRCHYHEHDEGGPKCS